MEKPLTILPLQVANMVNILTEMYRKEVTLRYREFLPDALTTEHIQKASQWFTACPVKKPGLIMAGKHGTGKTTLADAMWQWYNQTHYSVYGAEKRIMAKQSAEYLAKLAQKDHDTFDSYCRMPFLYIDDLGAEPAEINDYGTKITPFATLLLIRYEKRLPTLITTNLTGKQLSERYGFRVADRIAELFEFIAFKQETSYRKL